MTGRGDTIPVRPEESFAESRVADHLRRNLPHLVGEEEITFEQFPGGKANLTYLARAGAVELVLRRPPLGPVAPGSHDMGREFRVLSVLHRAYRRAPQAYHLCTDPEVMGKPFVVMERRRGHVIRDRWPLELERRGVTALEVAQSLIDALAELHAVDHEALGLADLGRPQGFVERQLAGWTDRWHRAKEEEVPAMDRLAAALVRSVPTPQRSALIHNDFKLDNTMVDDHGEIVAVLDWDMATLGDPLVDLGTTLAYWGGLGISPAVAADSVLLGEAMGETEAASRYAAATGLDVEGIGWYQALAAFRVAVIVQQIYIRYRRGQTSDERFAPLGALVAPMAERALETLRESGR